MAAQDGKPPASPTTPNKKGIFGGSTKEKFLDQVLGCASCSTFLARRDDAHSPNATCADRTCQRTTLSNRALISLRSTPFESLGKSPRNIKRSSSESVA